MFSSPKESSLPQPRRFDPSRFRIFILGIILAFGTIGLYWPVTRHDFVDYDDDVYVSSNAQVQRGLTVENINWAFTHVVCGNLHPVTVLSHMLDCQIYGLNPGGHHLTNLLLHALDTVLLFLLLHWLTAATWRSAMAAALFACHPLHVESVAWTAERKDVLSTCFGFLTLYLYVQYVRSRQPAGPVESAIQNPGRPRLSPSIYYWLAWFSLALGLMSKPMLVTWPFVMLLLDYWPLDRFKLENWQRLLVEKIPFFAITTAASLITFAVQTGTGAMKAMEGIPLGIRWENALVSYCRYLSKMFWPVDLAVFYPHPGHWPVIWVLLAGILLCGMTILAWQTRRRCPFLLVGWLWFVGTLVPVIGLVQVGIQAMADRYMYIPSVGVLIIVIWGVDELFRSWRFRVPALSVAGAIAIILCSVMTWQQLGCWQNSETLFQHALKATGDNLVARNNLGVALFARNQVDDAIAQFQAAIRLKPTPMATDNIGSASNKGGQTEAARPDPNLAEAYYNLGKALTSKGQTDAAINQFQEAIRLNPDYPEAFNNIGILLAAKGQTNDAIIQFQQALQQNPEYADAHYNLGNFLAKTGQADAAISEFQETLRLNPGDAEVHYRLGNLLARKGQTDDAISHFQTAIHLKPDFAEAHSNLGNLLAARGHTDEAITQFQEALRLKPDYRDAHYNLGNAFLKNGRMDEAAGQFQAVIQISPDLAPAHYYLGLCCARLGRLDDAIRQFQETLRLRPNDAEAATNLARALEIKNHPH